MNTKNVILELRQRFDASTFRWCVTALHQDPLVWGTLSGRLSDESMAARALEVFGADPEHWTPAAIALLASGDPITAANLRDPDWVMLEPELHQKAVQVCDSWINNQPTEQWTLVEAGLAAMALRERQVFHGNWRFLDDIPKELFAWPGEKTGSIIACLVGMAVEPAEVLSSLLPLNARYAIHGLLCIPAPSDRQAEILSGLFEDLPEPLLIEVFQALAQMRPELIAFLESQTFPPLPDPTAQLGDQNSFSPSPQIGITVTQSIHQLTQRGSAMVARQHPDQALQIYHRALQVNRRIQASITAQIALAYSVKKYQLKSEETDGLETAPQIFGLQTDEAEAAALQAWEEAVHLDPESIIYHAQLAWALLDSSRVEDAQANLRQVAPASGDAPASAEFPFLYWAACARLAARLDNLEQAGLYLRKANESCLPEQTEHHFLIELVELGIEIGDLQLAGRLAEQALLKRPNDPTALMLLAQIQLLLTHPQKSLENASLANGFAPDVNTSRLLIAALEANGEWHTALDEYENLLSLAKEPTIDILLGLAACALQAGQPETAVEVCTQALTLDAQDGRAIRQLGDVALSEGNSVAAQEYYQQAVQLSPGRPEGWLSLAQSYQNTSQPEQVLETLRLASQAVPDSIDIHLELGQALLKENSPTLALIPLRQAASLAFAGRKPSSYDRDAHRKQQSITLHLGRTLRELGYLEESRQVYLRIYGETPEDPSIDPIASYDYAKTLLGLHETKSALPWLDYTTTHANIQPALFDYARALLSVEPGPEEIECAIGLLQRLLVELTPPMDCQQLNPAEYAEAYALLAESLQAEGDLDGALQAFRKALDSNLVQQPAWRSRLSYGLGLCALSLDQTETAITAFLEAGQADPTNPIIFRSLAEAYASLDLTDDSFQASKKAVRLKSDDPEMLVWFTDKCLQLHDRPTGKGLPAYDYAQQAIERAINISPERADLWVRLAQLQVLRGNSAGALETLKKLSDTQTDLMSLSVDIFSQAASLFHEIGKPAEAILLLEQAIQLVRLDTPADSSHQLAGLYRQLADMNLAAENLPGGLTAIDQAISLEPDDPSVYRQKSLFQLTGKDLPGAAESLANALALQPDNWELHIQNALLQQATGALADAVNQAELAVKAIIESPDAGAECFTRWLAAILASGALQDERALEYLAFTPTTELPFEVACLKGELAFKQADLELVTGALASIVETAPHHPHLLALQARLVGFQEGITETSLQLFESAMSSPSYAVENSLAEIVETVGALGEPFYTNQVNRLLNAAVIQGITQAALDLKQWDSSENLCAQITELLPDFPVSQLLQMRLLVTRAENQQVCQGLQIVRHAPGPLALGEGARDAFERTLSVIFKQIDLSSEAACQIAAHWQARGQAIFNPGAESNTALQDYFANAAQSVADVSARVWSLCQAGLIDEAEQVAAHEPKHPLIAIQLALALASREPERAALLVQQALERLSNADLNLLDPTPMLNGLIAILMSHPNANLAELHTGVNAIQTALEIWPDEANWHSLAADLLTSLGAIQPPADEAAIQMHLEQAARLEPDCTDHHLKLGRFYAQNARFSQALAALETATCTAPENAEAWLSLARIQKETYQYEKAIASVDRSLGFASQSIEALLLRCELALLTKNPRGALSRAQVIINITPEHPQAWFIIAQSYNALGQTDKALQAIEHTISIEEDPLAAQRLRVQIVYSLYGPQKAIEIIQPLLETYPNDPVLNARLADYWDELHNYGSSLQAARIALQTGSEALPAETQSHLHLMIGKQARLAGQLDQAIYHCNEAIRKTPDSIEAYLELGRVHQDRRQNNQAIEIYQMAARIAPNDYHPYYQAGLALKDSKDYLGAETMFRRAAHLAPNEVNIHRQLAAVVALNLVHNRRVPITD